MFDNVCASDCCRLKRRCNLPLRIESTRPDVVDVKLRALYRGRDPEWYRESTTVLRVHVRAGVSVLGAPSPLWRHCLECCGRFRFRVDGAVIAPQSVMNVALPSPECQRLPWETTEGSAGGNACWCPSDHRCPRCLRPLR